jgi:hypothetical protein
MAHDRSDRGDAPGGFSIPILLFCAFGGRHYRSRGTTTDLLELGVLYLLGSVFLGAAIGFASPFMRGLVSRSLIGIAAVASLIIGIGLSMDAGTWKTDDSMITVSLSVLFGLALGGVFRVRAPAR